MGQTSSIYWDTPETAERAKLIADAENTSISKLVSTLINAKYEQEYTESPIIAICPHCGQESTFTFFAYWHEQSDLYRCMECRTLARRDDIMGEPIPV